MGSEIKVPTLEMLKFNNIFSGSYKNFNYKFNPNIKEGTVSVAVWEGMLCMEESDEVERALFKLTEQGFSEAVTWLESKENEMLKKTVK